MKRLLINLQRVKNYLEESFVEWHSLELKVRLQQQGLHLAGQQPDARWPERPDAGRHVGCPHVLTDLHLQLGFHHLRPGHLHQDQEEGRRHGGPCSR